MAEGSTGSVEEPATPLRTATIPAVILSASDKSAETGMVPMVNLSEGKDNGESQDASLTTDETSPMPDKQPTEGTGKTPSVLIIEDTTELAEIITATLENMNLITAHETHGNKAIEKFKAMNPDVVLLDISLPDMTGWKIMDAIKEKHESGGKMPIIIVITAYDDPANRLVGKLQGVYSYLIKPFTPNEIERAVRDAISSKAQ